MTNPHSPDDMASDNANIDILLATYNGAAFLAAQLDSILAQTHKNWRLVIRDDGSTDKTPEILEAFRARHPDKVVVFDDEAGNLGLVQNFSRLMEHAGAGYVAFCDQDDVWKPEKLELSLQKMHDMEAEHGAEKPLLVFTDLTIVDEDLRVAHTSFWKFQELRPERCNSLNRLILENVVTGCTALLNRPLLEKSAPIPEQAHVHDWWIALVAAAFGFAGYVAQPTVLYRQHGKNLMGARSGHILVHILRLPVYLFKIVFGGQGEREKGRVKSMYRQADVFYGRHIGDLMPEHRRDLALFLDIPSRNIFERFYVLKRSSFMPFGFFNSLRHIIYSHMIYSHTRQ